MNSPSGWPPLPLDEWEPTRDTLHMWTQIVGKIRLALSPPQNHWWHVPLYVTARGLTTSPIPWRERSFQIDFDFIGHQLVLACSDGGGRTMRLEPRTTADFYAELMARLAELGIEVAIRTVPAEVPDPIPFDQDTVHAAYDAQAAQRFGGVLDRANAALQGYRGGFLGKCSPVHFFWGSFDLAVTRFSGRRAPPHPGTPLAPDSVTREAYSHEVSSAGFWPGGAGMREPIFYAYAYPSPAGYERWPVRPSAARWSAEWGEFILPYDAVRRAEDPESELESFLASTYEAAAELGGWEREALERPSS
jgi:hypothetical protein